MSDKKQYLFGPVPSRRLGLSLGVDVVPFKICTLDCVYCQVGRTTDMTIERKDYAPIDEILSQLKEKIASGLKADYITLSGSGEPTLHSRLGELIEKIKTVTDIPVAILTNGTILWREDVRSDCAKADVVLPSLDAADEKTFLKINRPHPDINVEKIISGLCEFRKEFQRPIWLEVFLIEGINTGNAEIDHLKRAIELIRPDKVQLNTAVRPTADAGIERIKLEKMQEIASKLPGDCEIIADFSPKQLPENIAAKAEDVLSMLKRRPCSLKDICSGLSIHQNEALKYIGSLQNEGLITSAEKSGTLFYKAV